MKSFKQPKVRSAQKQAHNATKTQHKRSKTTTTRKNKLTKQKQSTSLATTTTTTTTTTTPHITVPFSLTSTNAFSRTQKRLNTTTKRNFGCASSGCGCGPSPEEQAQQDQAEQQQQQSIEFDEPQYNDKNIKTIEKMRKQQRDFSLRLYRSILRSHRHLPPEMRMLGDPYVKEEFRLHKNAKPEHLQPFFEQWIDYLGHLRHAFDNPEELGKNIPIETVDGLEDEQKEKLFKMHDETYRIFGGELNEADIGIELNSIPEHLKESGIFGDVSSHVSQIPQPQTDFAPPAPSKLNLTSTRTKDATSI